MSVAVGCTAPRAGAGPALGRVRRPRVVARADQGFCRDVVAERKEVSSQGKSFNVTFVAANEEITVQCSDNQYILDAAEAAGLDLPATCRGGICGACVTRVVDGTVDMSDIPDLSFTLSENEIAEGCALICMARATSDVRMETQADWGYSLGIAEWKTNGKFTGEVEPLMGKQWKEIKSEA